MPDERYSQEDRPMRLTTPLGEDELLIERLSGVESVSAPFEFTLDLLSTNHSLDAKDLLRKPVTIEVELNDLDGSKRHFHGIIRRFTQGARGDYLSTYRAEVVPSFWFLSLTSNCRIFQNLSVPDIIKKVFSGAGITNFRVALTSDYDPREYCVQYRESDLAFVSRLMEEEGIFYFFEHASADHTMVIADATSAVKAGPVAALKVTASAGGNLNSDFITEFETDSEVVAGKVTLIDHNFETPASRLLSTMSSSDTGTAVDKFRRLDYPGKFDKKAAGDRLARVRLEESETLGKLVSAVTTYRGLSAGQKVDVQEHYRGDANGSYHVIATQHTAFEGAYRSAVGSEPPFTFSTRFQAIPYATRFRPARLTPKSIIHGSQTAVVVGKSGEEIWVDKYGRVKVQFFWDELGKKDEHSSCWVRVSSSWAGKQWGFIQIPRIGQEVVVHFLEGDPDRPIITGSVYNAEQMPPYALPDNMTQSGLKTRSSKGGSAANANELRFEDLKGKELILLHAEKDLTTEVENDEIRSVLHDRTTTIKNNETKTIEDGNETITITKGKQTTTIEGNRDVTIKSGNDSLNVKMGNVSSKVDMGNVTLKTALGSISYDAMQGIELKVGQNSIKVDQTGITIKGLMVKVEGQIQTEIKGTITNVKADAMLMVKGGITMIN